jgi:hypothetical protein
MCMTQGGDDDGKQYILAYIPPQRRVVRFPYGCIVARDCPKCFSGGSRAYRTLGRHYYSTQQTGHKTSHKSPKINQREKSADHNSSE